MIVTLICEDRLFDILLPEKVRGQFWMEDDREESTSEKRKIFAIEAVEGKWQIRANKHLQLYIKGNETPSNIIMLEKGNLYAASWEKDGNRKRGYIFVEAYTQDRCTFKKWQILSDTTISIGKAENNEIIINNEFVSSLHAMWDDCFSVYHENKGEKEQKRKGTDQAGKIFKIY